MKPAQLARRGRPLPQSVNWFRRYENELKFLVAVVAIAIGFHEYLRNQWGQRVQRTLKIYERYQKGEVQSARLKIDRLWNNPEMWTRLTALHDAQGRLFFKPTREISSEITAERANVDQVFIVSSLFKEASICLSQKQCDRYTICKLFWPEAYKFYEFFRPYFNARNFAWDEASQKPDLYAWDLLHKNCDQTEIIRAFEMQGMIPSIKRYVTETLNL